jgi:small subunit ribosomal protein S2
MGGTPDLMFVIDTNKEAHRHPGSQASWHSGRRDRRFQLRSRRCRLPDPGQRRRQPRDFALLRSDRRACIDGIARQQGASGVDLGAWKLRLSLRSKKLRPKAEAAGRSA